MVKGVQKTYPSGIRHPSNRFEENVSVMEGDDEEVHEARLSAGFGGRPWRDTPEWVLTVFCLDERV